MKAVVAWLHWRYRRIVTLLTYGFYVCNPLITIFITKMKNPDTLQAFFRPLDNARRREELAELQWRSLKLRQQQQLRP